MGGHITVRIHLDCGRAVNDLGAFAKETRAQRGLIATAQDGEEPDFVTALITPRFCDCNRSPSAIVCRRWQLAPLLRPLAPSHHAKRS